MPSMENFVKLLFANNILWQTIGEEGHGGIMANVNSKYSESSTLLLGVLTFEYCVCRRNDCHGGGGGDVEAHSRMKPDLNW